jgi:hypothetical protein
MIDTAGLLKNLWAEAVHHHVWIQNRVPMHALPEMKTPHEIATGKKPDLSAVCPWGCKAWVKWLDVGKLEPRAQECHFVGIDNELKGYRIYWPGKNRVSIKRDVYFNESLALEPEEAPVEGENKRFTNKNHPQSFNTSRHDPEPSQPVENVPNTSNETHEPENVENAPDIHPELPEKPQEPPIPAPHQRSGQQNSLSSVFPSMTKINSAMENASTLQHHMLVPVLLKLLVLRVLSCWKRKVHWNQGEWS